MKGIYLVAILYVATLSAATLNKSSVADFLTKCPKDNPGNKTTFIPHENDCTKFYSCHMGEKGDPLKCPVMDNNGNRLHFNPKLQVCDWPWRAGCEVLSSTTSSSTPTVTIPSTSTSTTTTPTPSTSTTTTPSPSTSTTTTPSPSTSTTTTPSPSTSTTTTPSPSTSTTTTPSPSTSTTTTPSPSTSTTTTPSPSTSTTTTPSPSTSTTTTSSPSTTTLTTPPSDSCVSDDKIHLLPHKTMCDHYYSCLNGKVDPIPQKCDRNLLFNSNLRVCDYPENVKCDTTIPWTTDIVSSTIRSLITTSPNPSLTSTSFSPTPRESIEPSAWVCVPNGKIYKVPHEYWCNYYYWCVNGEKGPEPVKCPSYLVFNPVVGECDYPENTDCSGRGTPEPTKPTPTKPTPTKPTPTKPTPTKPTPTKPTPTKPTPTKPTPTKPTPTKPTPTKPTPTKPTPTPKPDKPRKNCPPKGSTEKARIAHPCLCNQYYECVDGEKILETCSFGKHFDYVREVCDWAAVVKCIRPLPTFDIPIFDVQIDDYNITCAPEGRTFQHEADCSAFYLCSNGEKTLKHCIEGLHFNMTIQTCDYPQKSCNLKNSLPTIDLNVCPPPDYIKKVFLPHECECTQYYECIGGKKVLRYCPNNLHFDHVRQICNTPTEVKCVDPIASTTSRTVPITTTTKAIDKSRIMCPSKGSIKKAQFPHPCLCNQYYECVEGDKVLRKCPIGMNYDEAKEICDWAANVRCIRSLSFHDILISDHDTKCLPDGRAFQHEVNCTEYYLCSNGKKILKSCLDGLHFNPSIQMCDYPQKECDLSTHLPTVGLGVCPPTDSVEKILLPHECECTQYYECIDGKQILRDCLNGLYYDHVRQICNEPAEVKCANLAPTIPTKRSSSTSDSNNCLNEKNEMPHEYDCRSYYKCSNGEKILKKCPKNLYFNPKLQVCDFPENVICDAGSENVPSMPTLSKCGMTMGITKIPHETNCNLYYICENGVSTLQKCHSQNLVFNPILKVCDFPENYICNLARAKSDQSTCIGTCPEEDPNYAVLLPNDDCKKFCMCSGGVAWVQSCPEPLYFDSVHKVCKRKKDAVCAKRPLSQDNAFTIVKIGNNDNSWKSLTDRDNNERRIYDNLDPSTCIGTCPEEDPEFAVLLPNDDCKKFCMCSGGVAWVQSCPEPLYFDSVQKVCKGKKDAVCGIRTFSQDNIFTIAKVGDNDNSLKSQTFEKDNNERGIYDNFDSSTCIGTCPEEDPNYAVLLPNDDCKKFCMCSGGVAWVQSCPEPLYFDSVHKVCKRKKDAVCAKRPLSQDNAFTIAKIGNNDNSWKSLTDGNNNKRGIYDNLDSSTCIGTCPEVDPDYAVLLPNDDCKKFCMCSGGVAWVQSCPEPLYFDSVQKVCKRKKDAVCAKRPLSQDNAFTIAKIDDNDNSWKSLIDRNNNERGIYDNLDPSTCIGTCPEEDPEYAVLLPNDDCKKFCMCSSGFAWVQSCPEPLYFDSVHKVCKQKKDAVCAKRPLNQDNAFTIAKIGNNDNSWKSLTDRDNNERGIYDNLDPSTCIGTCPEEDPKYAVLLPNDDCKKFCLCSNGLAYVQPCPEPLYFDSIEKVCKQKKDVVCAVRTYDHSFVDNSLKFLIDEDNNEREIYDNLDPSTCIGTCPEEDPEYAVLLPNDDCKKFCMCSSGFAWVQSCPEPLYFDSVQKICKQKKDAVCGVRLFKEDGNL